MACYKPLKAYRSGDGTITFNRTRSANIPINLPCGRCIGCRLDRSLQWATRCMHEAQMHVDNSFITLTYEEPPEGGSLYKPHFQTFIKKLRYHLSTRKYNPTTGRLQRSYRKFRYFHCGEYGEKLGRPHYHACLFGVDFPDKQLHSVKNGNKLYVSKTLSDLWGHGFATCAALTFETAAYTARYCTKKITGDKAADHYMRVDEDGCAYWLEPEYATMSNGIGADWYAKYKTDVFPHDEIIMRGAITKPPRYYTDKLKKEDPATLEKIQRKRIKAFDAHRKDNTEPRLQQREKVKQAQFRQLKRPMEQNNET